MRESEKLLDHLRASRPATPAPELRERVLSAAAGALPARPVAWEDRLWYSRPLRLAWASSILVLLALQALSDRRVDGSVEESFGRTEGGERPQVVALAGEFELRTIWRYRPTAVAPRPRAGRATAREEMP